jgi:hypothetical protein
MRTVARYVAAAFLVFTTVVLLGLAVCDVAGLVIVAGNGL